MRGFVFLFSILVQSYTIASPDISYYEQEFIRISFGDVEFGQEFKELEKSNILNDGSTLSRFFSYLSKIYISNSLDGFSLSAEDRAFISKNYPALHLKLTAQEIYITRGIGDSVASSLEIMLQEAIANNWKSTERFILYMLIDEWLTNDEEIAAISLLESFLAKTSEEDDSTLDSYYPLEIALFQLSMAYSVVKDYKRTKYYCHRMQTMTLNNPWYRHYGLSCEATALLGLEQYNEAFNLLEGANEAALQDKIYDAFFHNNITLAKIYLDANQLDKADAQLLKSYQYLDSEDYSFSLMPANTIKEQIHVALAKNDTRTADDLYQRLLSFYQENNFSSRLENRTNSLLLAEIAFSKQDFQQAVNLYRDAYQSLSKKLNEHNDFINHKALEGWINQAEVQRVKYEFTAVNAVRNMWIAIALAAFLVIAISTYFTFTLVRHRNHLIVENQTDYLTKIRNRKYSLKLIEKRLSNMHREDDKACLAMIDIDYFKKVNDTFGHEAGDNVLMTFAEYINSNIRELDIFGRFGGEEFILMLDGLDIETAVQKIEELREEIAAIKFSGDLSGYVLQFSCGLVSCNGGVGVDQLILKCDELLYAAKEKGRNRTESRLP